MTIAPRKKPTPNYDEKDAGKIELAKILIKMEETGDDSRYDITNYGLDIIGSRALANQYYFTLSSDNNGGYCASGVSHEYWAQHKKFNTRASALGYAMPCSEMGEMTYSFEDGRSLAANVKALKEAGFKFNEEAQNLIAPKLTQQIKALFDGKKAAPVFNKTSPKKPQQPKRGRGGIAGPGGCMSRGFTKKAAVQKQTPTEYIMTTLDWKKTDILGPTSKKDGDGGWIYIFENERTLEKYQLDQNKNGKYTLTKLEDTPLLNGTATIAPVTRDGRKPGGGKAFI